MASEVRLQGELQAQGARREAAARFQALAQAAASARGRQVRPGDLALAWVETLLSASQSARIGELSYRLSAPVEHPPTAPGSATLVEDLESEI